MPIYEYFCPVCEEKFELLRSLSCAEQDASCPRCRGKARRAISSFASFSKSSDGGSIPMTGSGSSCGGCAATSCATCP